MSTLLVSNSQIASAMRIADSTFRCFRLVSAPRDLPYDALPADHPNGRRQRGYHVPAVIDWIRRAAPHRAKAEFERKLYAFAAENLQAMEAA